MSTINEKRPGLSPTREARVDYDSDRAIAGNELTRGLATTFGRQSILLTQDALVYLKRQAGSIELGSR